MTDYARRFGIPYVLIRPGWVYGPGNPGIHGRVGIGTFGIFLHLGGGNTMPLTYVDNCAEATVLAGLTKGVEGEVFNIVDDDLPSSRKFLRLYKRNVRRFRSIYCSAQCQLCSVRHMGMVFEMVKGATAACHTIAKCGMRPGRKHAIAMPS